MDFNMIKGFENINIEDMDNKKKYDTIYDSNIIYINSKDRNYKHDTNYSFSISFTSNNINSAFINKDFKNIVKIELINIIMKNIYVDLKEMVCLYNKELITSKTGLADSNNIRLQRISDLPYILLTIEDLTNNTYGTNKELNKSTFTLILEENFDTTTNNSGAYVLDSSNYIEYGNINFGSNE